MPNLFPQSETFETVELKNNDENITIDGNIKR